jgi:DGQHR domain-containing protein
MSITNDTITLNVLKVRQPIGDFFIASIKAEDLVTIAYRDVRKLVEDEGDFEKYLGIQRPISTKRINQIKTYITASDATFPTAVILAIDEKCAEFEALDSSDNIGRLFLKPFISPDGTEDNIPTQRIAKVIDGQHRIAAFIDDKGNWCLPFNERPFDVNIAIFIGADVSEQANIFATVNLAQTKVNRSLVYDLTELAKTSSPHKACHNVAVALDSEITSPLYKRIKRLGTATPGRKNEPLTQAAFVEALLPFISKFPAQDRNYLLDGKKLKSASTSELSDTPFRNMFIHGKEVDIAEILYNYFTAIKQKWPNSWDAIDRTGNLLPRSNAFKAFMKFLKEDVYVSAVDGEFGRIPSSETFSKFLLNAELTDENFTVENFAPGSGGQSKFLQMLKGKIGLADMLKVD